MDIHKIMHSLIAKIIAGKWQLIIVVTIFMGYFSITYNVDQVRFIPFNISKERLIEYLAKLLPLLGLTFTVSIGFLLSFIQSTINRRNDLYSKWKSEIISLSKYLEDKSERSEIIIAAESSLWKIQKKSVNEFPIYNWNELIASFYEELCKDCKTTDADKLKKRLSIRFGYIEEIMNEIGENCVRQWIVSVFFRPVYKSFVLLLITMIIIGVSAIFPAYMPEILLQSISLMIIFLLTSLFLEVLYWLYRHMDENRNLD
jgi:hypothetical protein